jgi:hypothetical protein
MNKKYTIIIGILILAFAAPGIIRAATLNITADKNVTSIGEPIRVDISLDTKGESVNTVQSSILVPPDHFQIAAVNDGASIVSFWITQPTASSSGEIDLAGVIPGGYNGPSGSLVSLVLTPLAAGTGNITIATATVLANDGNGTALPIALASTDILVQSSTYTGSSTAEDYSMITPELFTPVVASDPDLFNGAFFLVFSTVDKGSGIDHYEVLEAPTNPSSRVTPSWQTATSPYLLQDQSLSSNIYVRAVNHAGTFLVVELPARYPYDAVATRSRVTFSVVVALLLVLALALLAFFFVARMRRKQRSSGL